MLHPSFEVEFKLKKILADAGRAEFGVFSEIARATDMHYTAVQRIFTNQVKMINRETFAKLCRWLESEGLGEGLPGALIGYRPSSLLAAMVQGGQVSMYLGERRPPADDVLDGGSIAGNDARVMFNFQTMLFHAARDNTDATGQPLPPLIINLAQVPCHPVTTSQPLVDDELAADIETAGHLWHEVRQDHRCGNTLIIGSPKVNYMTELMVADTLQCKPFATPPAGLCLYMLLEDLQVPSCFCGTTPPPGSNRVARPGVYYRPDPTAEWSFMASNSGGEDVGVVIVHRDPGMSQTELVIFGPTGQATAAMGRILRQSPDRFWPTEATGQTSHIYLCQFERPTDTHDDILIKKLVAIPALTHGTPEKPNDPPGKRPRKSKKNKSRRRDAA